MEQPHAHSRYLPVRRLHRRLGKTFVTNFLFSFSFLLWGYGLTYNLFLSYFRLWTMNTFTAPWRRLHLRIGSLSQVPLLYTLCAYLAGIWDCLRSLLFNRLSASDIEFACYSEESTLTFQSHAFGAVVCCTTGWAKMALHRER